MAGNGKIGRPNLDLQRYPDQNPYEFIHVLAPISVAPIFKSRYSEDTEFSELTI